MLCAVTVRRLKPGAFDDYLNAWQLESAPPGWTRVVTARSIDDENEVVSFGLFEGSLEDLRRSRQEFDYAGQRARVDEFVASTGTDGIFEVVSDQSA